MKALLQFVLDAKQALVRVLEAVVVLLLATLVLDVLWQVLSRLISRFYEHFPSAWSAWTDELATLLVIWLALLGAGAAFGRRAHLGADFLVRQLDSSRRKITAFLVQLIVIFFAVSVLILGGIDLVQLAWMTGQVSPALGINMGHVYLALPISGTFVVLFSLETILETFTDGDGGVEPNVTPQPPGEVQ